MPILRREIVQSVGRSSWSFAVVVSCMWLLGVTSSADVLDDFTAQFTDQLTPSVTSIKIPPPVVASVLRERYLADFDAEQFASQLSELDAAYETPTVSTELTDYQSDLRPVALEIQLRQLETLAPGLAHSRTGWVNEGGDNTTRVVSPFINEVVLQRLRHLIAEVVYSFDHTPSAARRPLDELHACVTLLEEDAALWEQDAAVLCIEMLERRLILWEQALFARIEYDKAIVSLATMSLPKRQNLLEWTSLTREFLRSKELAPHGATWANEWEIAALEELLTRCQRDTQLTESEVLQISDYARRLVAALDPATFTATQRRWLRVPGIQELRKSLAPWGQTFIEPFELLRAVERFEASPSPETEGRLRTIATLMASSPHRAWATLGKTTISLHNSPNVKLYLSSILLNHLLPTPEREYARFRDVVGGRDVTGRRRTETQVALTTISSDDAVRFSLDVRGRVAALGTTSAFTTTLQSLSSAEYFGRKTLEWTDAGFKFSPAVVTVNNTRTSLRNVQGLGIPLFSGMVTNAVRSQYEMQQDDIRNETTSKIVQQTRAKINSETEQQCSQVTRWYRENVLRPAESLGLAVTMRESRTDEHWLLPAWRVGKNGDLASYPPAPETPLGAFADFKVHESMINMIIDSLDIGGKTMTIGELRGVIGKRFNQAAMLQETENDDMVVCLAAERPLRLRLHDGRIDLVLGVERLTVNQQTMRDFQVFATYIPEEMSDGSLEWMRDGIVRLGGEIMPRHQIPLRTVFGKVFAAQRRIEMSPAMLRDDERFEGLTLGLSRIEHGWFAVALVLSRAGEATSRGTYAPNAPVITTHSIRRSAR